MSAVPLTSSSGPGFDPALISGMLETMVGGAYVCRVPDGALLWYNDAAADIWGIRPALPDNEASFLGTLQMFTLEGTPIERRNASDALVLARTQNMPPENALMVRSDGTSLHVQTRTSLLRNRSGETVATFHQIYDVSERRRVEDALRASEERYRQILQSTRDCIKVLDLNCLLISINPEGLERLGIVDASTVIGTPWIDYWHGTDRELARAACATAKQGDTGRFQGRYISASGEVMWWDASVTPILNTAKEVINLLVISREITHHRLAEDALRQSEKLAAVGRLAASISHEINNPLESVTNLIYLAQHSSHVEEIRRFLDMADEQVKRVSHIVNQTLRFHRVSARAANVDAHELIDSVLALYRGRLINASVNVSFRYRGIPTILCYEGNCRQVLSNLIANAVDAMRTGGRMLLRAQPGTDWRSGRKGLKITVADTGHGITAAVRSRLFQPFQTTKGENGTGLGLWISKGIVDRDGGTLRLRSRAMSSGNASGSAKDAGKSGTVFVLFLPEKPAPQEPSPAKELISQWS